MTHDKVNDEILGLVNKCSDRNTEEFAGILFNYYITNHYNFLCVANIKLNKIFFNNNKYRVSYMIDNVPLFCGLLQFNEAVFTSENNRIYIISQIVT